MDFNTIYEKLKYEEQIKINKIRNYTKKRFIYTDISKYINKDLIKIIIGPRGVGKTTILLQLIKNNPKKSIYFSADSLWLNEKSILEFIGFLYEKGIRNIYIDEIHQINDWYKIVKNAYDTFGLNLFISGSNAINLFEKKTDLSRRSLTFSMEPFSMREYLYFDSNRVFKKLTLDKIKREYKQLQSTYPYQDMNEYYTYKSLPLYLGIKEEELTNSMIFATIEKIIYKDILMLGFEPESTQDIKATLLFLARSPANVSISSIAQNLENISKNTIKKIIDAFIKAKILFEIHPTKIKSTLRTIRKFYFYPPYRAVILNHFGYEIDRGIMREEFFLFHLINNYEIHFWDYKGADFEIDKQFYEIGGKGKTRKQLKYAKKGYIIKDKKLSFEDKAIPLYLFGFTK